MVQAAREAFPLDANANDVLNDGIRGGPGLTQDATQNISGPYNGYALFPAGEPTGGDGQVGAEALLGRSGLLEEGAGSPVHRRQGLGVLRPPSATDARARTPAGQLDGAPCIVLMTGTRAGEQGCRGSWARYGSTTA